ncbi:hypothetical protein H1R20_g10580, partial [Candolleomyces eurysporus]
MLVSPQSITFAVLLIPGYQWLDIVGPIAYINTHSRAVMQMPVVPESIRAKAPVINWHYISSEAVPPIDYLLVPGANSSRLLSNELSSFIHDRFPTLKGVLTVCTGSVVFAQTGLLDGVHVASNKVALKYMVETGRLNKKSLDLAAEFARVHFDPELVDLARNLTEYDSNPAQPDPFSPILDGVDLG